MHIFIWFVVVTTEGHFLKNWAYSELCIYIRQEFSIRLAVASKAVRRVYYYFKYHNSILCNMGCCPCRHFARRVVFTRRAGARFRLVHKVSFHVLRAGNAQFEFSSVSLADFRGLKWHFTHRFYAWNCIKAGIGWRALAKLPRYSRL